MPTLPEAAHAGRPGWTFSSVVLVPNEAIQGASVLESLRVARCQLATEVAASQLLAVVDRLVARRVRPVILDDRW